MNNNSLFFFLILLSCNLFGSLQNYQYYTNDDETSLLQYADKDLLDNPDELYVYGKNTIKHDNIGHLLRFIPTLIDQGDHDIIVKFAKKMIEKDSTNNREGIDCIISEYTQYTAHLINTKKHKNFGSYENKELCASFSYPLTIAKKLIKNGNKENKFYDKPLSLIVDHVLNEELAIPYDIRFYFIRKYIQQLSTQEYDTLLLKIANFCIKYDWVSLLKDIKLFSKYGQNIVENYLKNRTGRWNGNKHIFS